MHRRAAYLWMPEFDDMSVQCWASVAEAGPTMNKHGIIVNTWWCQCRQRSFVSPHHSDVNAQPATGRPTGKLITTHAWCHMRGQPDRTPSASSSLVVGRRGGGEGERTPRGAQTGHLGSTSGTVFYCNFCRACRFVSAPVSIIHWLICGIHNIFRFKENIFHYKFATNLWFLIQSWSHFHVFKNLVAKP